MQSYMHVVRVTIPGTNLRKPTSLAARSPAKVLFDNCAHKYALHLAAMHDHAECVEHIITDAARRASVRRSLAEPCSAPSQAVPEVQSPPEVRPPPELPPLLPAARRTQAACPNPLALAQSAKEVAFAHELRAPRPPTCAR